jgi:hypothetical protein
MSIHAFFCTLQVGMCCLLSIPVSFGLLPAIRNLLKWLERRSQYLYKKLLRVNLSLISGRRITVSGNDSSFNVKLRILSTRVIQTTRPINSKHPHIPTLMNFKRPQNYDTNIKNVVNVRCQMLESPSQNVVQ